MGGPAIEVLGDAGLLLRFGESIDPDTSARVLACFDRLRRERWPGIVDLVPAYTTLAVFYDPLQRDADELATALRALPLDAAPVAAAAPVVELPVCYEPPYAEDLATVAAHAGLAPDTVVRIHSQTVYRVCFLGFMPGFPYLDGLDARLHVPRRATPRMAVPAGSVAIGGAQTGVYPLDSPGGWHIIGRTPLRLFAPEHAQPCLLAAGDRVRFVPIDHARFRELEEDA